MIDIALLGTGGMIPLHGRHLTAMLAKYNGNMLLIDCGEGTQVTLRELGWGFANINYLCFTHLHADHIAGLPGFLLSLSNYGKTSPLIIVGPKGTENVVKSLCVIAPELYFPIEFIELSFDDNAPQDFTLGDFHMSALPLEHALECFGYSISIPRRGKFDLQRAKDQNIPVSLWSKLQHGEAAEHEGKLYTPDMVLGAERKGIKVSYVTDTRPIPAIAEFVSESDLFICEGMYGDDEFKSKAYRLYHTVFSEAATLAKAGNVKELWLTHYSQAMDNPEDYLEVATAIFENTKTGYDRMTTSISFEE